MSKSTRSRRSGKLIKPEKAKRKQRVWQIHGSLMYRGKRQKGFDAAAAVVELLDAPRLSVFERVLFGFAKPWTVLLTTPNREDNVKWETLGAGRFRQPDHRFEWSRQEFQDWARDLAGRFSYMARVVAVGRKTKNWDRRRRWGFFRDRVSRKDAKTQRVWFVE
jgi:hypothetical protein